jgi:NAD(P)-dependent dehydrogenase (short-subunit alcohol dehydrogenase family)
MFTVLITGANAGIGLAVAAQLVARDDTHVIVAARSSEKAQGAVKELSAKAASSSKLTPVVLDLDDEASGAALRKELEQQGIKLNVLVNNAAIAFDDDEVDKRGLRAVMRDTFETNVFGTAHLTETLEPLLERGSVRPAIVNVSSELGSFALTPTFPPELHTVSARMAARCRVPPTDTARRCGCRTR